MAKLFNGTTDIIDLGSAASLDDIGGSPGNKTVAAWIYLNGWGEGNFGRIWQKGTFATTGWFFYTYNGDGTTTAVASFILNMGGATNGPAVAVSNTLSLNKWWFVAGTYTPSDGGPRLWVGDLAVPMAEVTYSVLSGDARADVTGYGSDAADTGYIGNRLAADRTFDGRMAELMLFANKLTVAQLESLRTKPLGQVPSISGITNSGYYPLNEGVAGSALDLSGNGNNGTVTGTSVADGPPLSTAWTRIPYFSRTMPGRRGLSGAAKHPYRLPSFSVEQAAGSVTVAITGVAGTGSVGSVTVTNSEALTGLSATASLGSLVMSDAEALTGLGATGALGTMTPQNTESLSGVVGTMGLGSVAQVTYLTGLSATGTLGTVSVANTDTLVGEFGTTSLGSITPMITIPLSGVTATGAAGTVTSPGQTLSGVVGTTSLGSLSIEQLLTLLGLAATSGLGSVGTSVATMVFGVQATASLGTVDLFGPPVALTGVSATGSVGTLSPSIDVGLAGLAMGTFIPTLRRRRR